jgi:hypothetical protein
MRAEILDRTPNDNAGYQGILCRGIRNEDSDLDGSPASISFPAIVLDAENASGHHDLEDTFEFVISTAVGLESDLNHLGRFACHVETKCISPEFRPLDIEVAAQLGLMALDVVEATVVGFELALDQEVGAAAVVTFLK